MVRDERASDRLRALGAEWVVVAQPAQAPGAASVAVSDGVDVLVDTTGHVELAAVPDQLTPRGRILLITGQGRLDVDLWRFYTREIQLLGFVMSGMTVAELAAAAEWITTGYAERPLSVSVGRVMNFRDAAHAHALLESGQLPRLDDGTVGRVVLRP